MSRSLVGPWLYEGLQNELVGNSNINYWAYIDFKSKSYFLYYNGVTNTAGGSFCHLVSVNYLHSNNDGARQRVQLTTEGIQPAT
jgi:hypothetical protein